MVWYAAAAATEQYHVLITLMRGRAQRLVLKAGEPEWGGSVSISSPTI